MERFCSLAFLWKGFFYQADSKSPSVKGAMKLFSGSLNISSQRNLNRSYFSFIKEKFDLLRRTKELLKDSPGSSGFPAGKVKSGFATVLLLSFSVLILTGILGLSSLSLGIKDITRSQSHCIRENLQGQRELGLLLEKILRLNDTVLFFHRTRQSLSTSLTVATAVGSVHLIPLLKKKLDLIRQMQKLLILRQRHLLTKGFFLKRKSFKKFKRKLKKFNMFHIREESFYKKALALERRKKGDKAYIYKPVPDFVNRQKSRFSWKMPLFLPWDQSERHFLGFLKKPFIAWSCTASLKKEGGQWKSILYH